MTKNERNFVIISHFPNESLKFNENLILVNDFRHSGMHAER